MLRVQGLHKGCQAIWLPFEVVVLERLVPCDAVRSIAIYCLPCVADDEQLESLLDRAGA